MRRKKTYRETFDEIRIITREVIRAMWLDVKRAGIKGAFKALREMLHCFAEMAGGIFLGIMVLSILSIVKPSKIEPASRQREVIRQEIADIKRELIVIRGAITVNDFNNQQIMFLGSTNHQTITGGMLPYVTIKRICTDCHDRGK